MPIQDGVLDARRAPIEVRSLYVGKQQLVVLVNDRWPDSTEIAEVFFTGADATDGRLCRVDPYVAFWLANARAIYRLTDYDAMTGVWTAVFVAGSVLWRVPKEG